MSFQKPKLVGVAVNGSTLQQVENFMYHGVVFTSDVRQNKDIETRIEQTKFCVSFIALWSQNGIFQTPKSCQF